MFSLEEGEGANLALDVIDGRHRPATDVVRDAAPTHRGPIDDLDRRNERVGAVAAHQLFEGL